jgi:hypothetical protein
MSHVDPFNALGGFSVGIPPELVIDETGNVVNNVNAPNSNVTANRVFANGYFYANGLPFTPNAVASGSNTQVQYNNNGNFGASSAFTFNSATNLLTVTKIQVGTSANLGNVANVIILGGTNGYFLQTDGAGNLTWAAATGNGGNGTPGGANTQVQFNDAGAFGGNAGFTYNKITNTLTTGNIVADYIVLNWDVTANVVVANYLYGDGSNITNVAQAANSNIAITVSGNAQPNITSVGTLTSLNLAGNITNANVINANLFAGNGSSLFGIVGSNVVGTVANANFAAYAGNVTVASQPNITTVGNLTNLVVIGNTTLGNNVTANFFTGNLYGLANLARNVTLASQPNITSLGTLTTLSVSGNTNLGVTNTTNLFANNFTVESSFTTLGNVIAGNVYANTGNIRANLILGTLTTGLQPNITTVGVLTNLTVAGNISGANANLGNLASANFLSGTLTTNAQPNVNFLGNIGWLNVQTGLAGSNGNITFNGSILGNGPSSDINITGNLNAGNYVQAELLIGEIATAAQPSITSLGNLVSLTVEGNSNLGNVGNVKILGGINGYVLSTDGIGNLSWIAQSGGGGNGTPGGSNTQIQFNNAGSFGGSPSLTWNDFTAQLTVNGNTTVTSNLLTTNFITTNANATTITASGNISAGNISGGNLVSANFLSGTLTTNSQLNIHYLGNVGWLNVDTAQPNSNGNITFNGSINGIGGSSDINITGNLNAGNYVQAELLIGIIDTAAQPNITSLGNLTDLTVIGESNLGNAGNVKILGGNANYVLSTDGTGNLSWIEQAASNATTPGGLNTYIQFNDNGSFGGDNTFTWNKNSDTLFVGGNINVSSVITTPIFISNIATGTAPLQVTSTTPVANLGVETAATVRDNAQPNITSVGTLTSLTVSGNINTSNLSVTNTFNAGNITTPGTIGTTNLNVTGTANFSNTAIVSGSGTLTINGKFNSAGSSNVNLGSISNLHISGGINGYVLATDGNANLYWTAGGGGGNGNPGGSNTQVQYNDNGTFAGSAFFTFNENTSNVQIAGNLIANSLTIGAGIYEFSHSNVYFATTISDTPNQTILSIEADDLAGLDLIIISTDNGAGIRNLVKISTVVFGNVVNYVEYSTLPVNGYIGDFTVSYDAGNIITPATVQLKLSPQTANLMVHKMCVTRYKE